MNTEVGFRAARNCRGRGHWQGALLGATLLTAAGWLGAGISRAQDATALPLPRNTPANTAQAEGDRLPSPRPGETRPALPSRLHALPGAHGSVGATPVTTPKAKEKVNKYVKEVVDPETTLDLIVDRTRLIVLKQPPRRVQIANENVATYALLSPTDLSLLGRGVGATVLTIWFTDPADNTKQETLTYHVRVLPDPEAKDRLEMVYDALEKEINKAFPDSRVTLQLVGDKLVVMGQAKDIADAAQIIRVIRSQAPGQTFGADAARIPVDRVLGTGAPDPNSPDGLIAHAMEEFVATGGPEIINLLRINGEQQVLLRVTVAEVNRAAARSIGMNFNILNDDDIRVFANTTGSIATGGLTGASGGLSFTGLGSVQGQGSLGSAPGVALGPGGFNNLPTAIDNGQVNLAINALRVLNYAKSLAEPNLVALNGQTASFQAGGQFPVPIVTGFTAAGLQGVDFVPYGVSLNFTPFITDRDRIRLSVSAEVSSRDLDLGNTNIGGNQIPNLITRNFQTVVELREGQTLAVAGLIQNNLGAVAHRVPFIGDLPFIGRFASFDRIQAGEQELMVLITPVLVKAMDCEQVPPLPGHDLFEPDDLEFYLLGRLESHLGRDYRSPIRTDIDRIKMYRRYEQTYLVGPHGYSLEK